MRFPVSYGEKLLRATAYHEAGHAVMARYWHIRVRSATIKPEPPKEGLVTAGHVLHDPIDGDHRIMIEWYISRAGLIAEAWVTEPEVMPPSNSSSDHERVERLMKEEALKDFGIEDLDCCDADAGYAFIERANRTEDLIRERMNELRPKVELVAALLIKRETLTGDELVLALETVDLLKDLSSTSPPIVATASPATVISEDLSADAPEKEINQCRETAAVFTPR